MRSHARPIQDRLLTTITYPDCACLCTPATKHPASSTSTSTSPPSGFPQPVSQPASARAVPGFPQSEADDDKDDRPMAPRWGSSAHPTTTTPPFGARVRHGPHSRRRSPGKVHAPLPPQAGSCRRGPAPRAQTALSSSATPSRPHAPRSVSKGRAPTRFHATLFIDSLIGR